MTGKDIFWVYAGYGVMFAMPMFGLAAVAWAIHGQ